MSEAISAAGVAEDLLIAGWPVFLLKDYMIEKMTVVDK
jgi:hypothetical protein